MGKNADCDGWKGGAKEEWLTRARTRGVIVRVDMGIAIVDANS